MFRITLDPQQLQALAGLIDAGVRHMGIAAARDAASLMNAIQAAEQLAPAQPQTEETSNG